MGQDRLLVITDQVAVSISAVSDAIKKLRKEEVVVVDPMIIYILNVVEELYSLMSLESSSIDDVVSLCKKLEFPSDQLLGNISRVLKPGGSVLFYLDSQTVGEQMIALSGNFLASDI
ncbi:anamorsin homolog [Salvia splendens]|uniref:anamorsin homolog n=1 Tax=Salvia splendens TaxID=180675 RepID=UPI001C25B973|nr:anamorsin homolog [Salvia splendens]